MEPRRAHGRVFVTDWSRTVKAVKRLFVGTVGVLAVFGLPMAVAYALGFLAGLVYIGYTMARGLM